MYQLVTLSFDFFLKKTNKKTLKSSFRTFKFNLQKWSHLPNEYPDKSNYFFPGKSEITVAFFPLFQGHTMVR